MKRKGKGRRRRGRKGSKMVDKENVSSGREDCNGNGEESESSPTVSLTRSTSKGKVKCMLVCEMVEG